MQVAVLGGLVVISLCLISGIQAGKRFQDVMEFERRSGKEGHHNQIHGWFPDSSPWDEKLYPAWKTNDVRWENCWRGGKVLAILTSDSPALIGSNVTFAVTLKFPRCQKENEDGDIVYERGCGNASSSYQDQYVYNWTKWVDFCDVGNCSYVNKYPDGRPLPHRHDWRWNNFIYVFSTMGQYYTQIGRSSALLSLNTTNITAGTQMIEVSVFRRGHQRHYPVTKASGIYIVTDQIPFYVNISQTNDKNSSDNIYIKDSPIKFDIKIHDPSNYLKKAIVSFDWDYGDGNGSSVSNNPLSSHTYTTHGNFSLNLTIKAAIPGPCQPVTPTPVPTTYLPTTTNSFTTANTTDNSTDLPSFEAETAPLTTERPNVTTAHTTTIHSTPVPGCFIYRYGHYNTKITVVDGILQVSIVEMTSVKVSTAQTVNSLMDFIVSCQGSLPTDACTIVSDSTCTVPQDMICEEVPASDQCLVTLRRAFVEPGSYCVNITLSDDASLALASTLVSIEGEAGTTTYVKAVLVHLGLIALAAVIVAVTGVLLYKKYKPYRPIENAADQSGGQGIKVYFSQIKNVLFQGNHEHEPLLKSKAGII
ncbi:protein QNR-71-like [Pseudophryne corroboree]|uniref:protein QNR-71-like n=1 Tax=Pseudophryne corroboree TaxID=495146 RepID=UPI003081252C